MIRHLVNFVRHTFARPPLKAALYDNALRIHTEMLWHMMERTSPRFE